MSTKASKLRAKKLGALLYDARLASRRSLEDCAQAIITTSEIYEAYETGNLSPSLPEIEVLAYFLEAPLDHFWGNHSLSEEKSNHHAIDAARLIPLRQRMVGALLRRIRSMANVTTQELAQKSGIPEDQIVAYELADKPIPLPELELLINHLGGNLDEFIDQNGVVGAWMEERKAIDDFLELPTDLREFVSKPINRPYVELALRLSELSIERLRAIAEGILEITY
mgnify:CR=1 FL=1